MLRTRAVAIAALAAAAALIVGGCGGTPASPAAPAATAPAAPAADIPAVVAKEVPELGKIVVDKAGFTLYRFDNDSPKPSKATCVDGCAEKWPPVVVDPKGQLTIDGVEQSAIGTVVRPDGKSQLTIGGWPVYRFASDGAPGATGGQGVGGTWFAVKPDGKKAG